MTHNQPSHATGYRAWRATLECKMKIRITFFLLQLIVFVCCTGCTQRRGGCHEAQSIHVDKETTDKAYQTIIHDLDALHDELKTAERVVGASLDPKVYKTLNRAKQAANAKNYEETGALYRQTLELARDHLVDDATLVAFRQLVNLERRLDGNSPCEEAWADLLALAVKQRLRRIVIPDFEIGPPKTLIDALDYFKQASRDYEDPKIPIEQRGVSFVLKLRDDGTGGHLASEGEDPFAAPTAKDNAPVIPKLSARFISLYDAINLVCDVTGYMFNLRGGLVLITPREDGVEPMRQNENAK